MTRKKRRNDKKRANKRAKIERSRLQSLDTVLWFGKYKKLTVRELGERDMPYLKWLAASDPREDAWRMRELVEFLRTLT